MIANILSDELLEGKNMIYALFFQPPMQIILDTPHPSTTWKLEQ